jgi:isocitrate/isopropylmalate dehydrogenase
MSEDHAKREMETSDKPIGDKPTTSHGKASSEESRNKKEREGKEILFPQVASEWRQEKEDEEGGLLRDRHFITFHIRLRRAIHHF